MIQGPNKQNIEVMLSYRAIEFTRDLLDRFSSDNDCILRGFEGLNDIELIRLQGKGPEMLMSFLEGKDISSVAIRIGSDIEAPDIKNRMSFIFSQFCKLKKFKETMSLAKINSKLSDRDFDGMLAEGFALFSLINILS